MFDFSTVPVFEGSLLTPVGITNSIRGYKTYVCVCSCGSGVEKIVRSDELKNGKVKSCGCLKKQQTIAPRVVHGKVKSPLYTVWRGMKLRCGNPNHQSYKRYGGRGITIYEPWKNDFGAFEKFFMSIGWEKGLQIDRIDNDDGYHPLNVRCVTPLENVMNRPFYRGMTSDRMDRYL